MPTADTLAHTHTPGGTDTETRPTKKKVKWTLCVCEREHERAQVCTAELADGSATINLSKRIII